MRRILTLPLSVKLLSATVVTLIAVAVIVGLAARLQYQTMLADREEEIRSVLDVARGVAAKLVQEETAGKLTHAEAMERFRSLLHDVSFGKDGYVFAYRMDGLLILQPQEPQNEGKNLIDRHSVDGQWPVREQIAIARNGGGTLTVLRPREPGQPPVAKLNVIQPFPPWDMLIAAGLYIDDIDAAFRATLLRLGLIGAGVIAIGGSLTWFIGRGVARSVGRLKAAMERLARNELEAAIPGVERGDEIGAMAGAVLIFRDHMRSEARLAVEHEAERERGFVAKSAAVARLADTIETETSAAMGQVSEISTALTAMAARMHDSATRTGAAAQGAAATSAEAVANAQAVATATEELSASIHEIGGQVAQSTAMVGRAVEAGRQTKVTIATLTSQVARIGSVADVISEIAAKTNLLALNATIEAARAGDAGKGFAVVAGEVKQLAMQTARSTQEIAQSIAEVRAGTTESVASVDRIEQTINAVNAISGSIAAAVEEQGAATSEIARNVARTAAATSLMARRIAEVSAEAEGTDRQAAQMQSDTVALAGAMGELRHAVVRTVRASSADADRRSAPRIVVDLPCRVSVGGGGEQVARVIDLSEGGASIAGVTVGAAGANGSLLLNGHDAPLGFTVRHAEDGIVHVVFRLDEAGARRLRTLLERLGNMQAA